MRPAAKEPYFDLLRGLAAQAVLIGHTLNVFFPAHFMMPGDGGYLEARHDLPMIQNFGVLVFFVISGFLIARSADLGRQKGRGFTEFAIARFARIFAPMVPFLLILYVVESLLYGASPNTPYQVVHTDVATLAANLTMLFNNPALAFVQKLTGLPLSYGTFGTAQQLWTVVIEWWIYIAFGALVFVRRQRWPLYLAIAAVAAIVPFWSLYQGKALLVAWIIGAAGWHLRGPLGQLSQRALLGAFLVLSLTAAVRATVAHYDFYDLGFTVLASVALILVKYAFADRQFGGRLIAYMSNVSYSLYLVHLSILIGTATFIPTLVEKWWSGPLMFAVCNVAGWLFWLAIERHHEKVRDRLMQRGKPTSSNLSATLPAS